jgi:hypothetical protein
VTSTESYLVYGVPLEEGALRGSLCEEAADTPIHMRWMGNEVDGLKILTYYKHDHPMHIVFFAGTGYEAERGFIADVDPSKLVVPEGTAQKLREFCQKHGLNTMGEPGWLLCSYWG